jgi:hypothetical protein
VSFLGVFLGSSEKDIRKFAATYHITFPVGKNSGVAEALDVKAMPATVFIDREGRILKVHMDTIYYDELATAIEKMLSGSPLLLNEGEDSGSGEVEGNADEPASGCEE